MGELDRASSSLSDFSSALGGSIHDMAQGVDIDLRKNDAVRAAGNEIYAGLDQISAQIDSLNAFARDESMQVIGNLNEINRRFNSMTDLMKNERDRLNSLIDEGIFEDHSDLADSPARIRGCRNEADVNGDLTTGGITGTVGIEYDLDPDEDVLRRNDRSLDYTFGVTAVILDSENAGRVEARGNYVGGIAGKMDLGRLLNNRNIGDVSSENGDFVGGIAGYGDGYLDGNSARCRVTGDKNTGGIDNIDYASRAERSPEPLETVLVKFLVEGHLLGSREVKTGTLLKELSFPEAEKREGFLLLWDKEGDTALAEDTVVTGAYRLAVAVLHAPENYPGTSKPVLMADGLFREEDRLEYSGLGENHYKITVPDDGLSERKIRVHKPDYKKYIVLVNGTETPVEAFGDYRTFTAGDRKLEILIEKTGFPTEYLIAAAAAGVFIVLAAALKKTKKKYLMEGITGVENNSWNLYYGECYHSKTACIIGPSLEGDGIFEVTITGSPELMPKKIFEDFTMKSPMAPNFKNAKLIKKSGCSVKSYLSMKNPCKGNVICIGDSAAMIEVETQGGFLCGDMAAQAVIAEMEGRKGFDEYTKWWQEAFEFNQPDHMIVSQGYALAFVYTDDELDYLFSLCEGHELHGTYSQYLTPKLIWDCIRLSSAKIKEERPEIYAKMVKMGQAEQ